MAKRQHRELIHRLRIHNPKDMAVGRALLSSKVEKQIKQPSIEPSEGDSMKQTQKQPKEKRLLIISILQHF